MEPAITSSQTPQFAHFTRNDPSIPKKHYFHPRNISEVKEPSSCTDQVNSFAKFLFKILIAPVFLFERLSHFALIHLVCPFQFFPCSKDYYENLTNKKRIEKLCNGEVTLNSCVLQPEGDSGPQLDAITIISNQQRGLDDREQKWIVVALPNFANHQDERIHTFLINYARYTGLCIAVTNYRGARKEPRHRPDQFNDLVNDVDELTKRLCNGGVHPKNIVIQGVSLGGAVASYVAARHQEKEHEMSVISENTFDHIGDAVRGYSSGSAMVHFAKEKIEPYLVPEANTTHSLKSRVYYALKELFFCIPHLIFRVIVFTTLFFDHLFQGNFAEAFRAVAEICKTVLLDPVIFVSSLFVLLSSPFADYTQILRYLNLKLCEKFEDSLVFTIFKSRLYSQLAKRYIEWAKWNTNVADAWLSIKGAKFSSTVREDNVILWEASLGKGLEERSGEWGNNGEVFVNESTDATHRTFLMQSRPEKYFTFLEKALKINFPQCARELSSKTVEAFTRMPLEEALTVK